MNTVLMTIYFFEIPKMYIQSLIMEILWLQKCYKATKHGARINVVFSFYA